MTIIEDFIVNLAAGFTQTLLQQLARRAIGDPQQRGLQRASKPASNTCCARLGRG